MSEERSCIIDLCCGNVGWVVPGYEDKFIGVDIVRTNYPGHLIIDDVRAWHGRWLKNAALIVASPPCESFSLAANRWKTNDGRLFDISLACWAICMESGVPWVIENVRGAFKWFGEPAGHYGSFYLWGPAAQLIPQTKRALKSQFRRPCDRAKIPTELAEAICMPYLQPRPDGEKR